MAGNSLAARLGLLAGRPERRRGIVEPRHRLGRGPQSASAPWLYGARQVVWRAATSCRRGQKHTTLGGITRKTAYLYADEEKALEEKADKECCSKSEIIRRALREYLKLGS